MTAGRCNDYLIGDRLCARNAAAHQQPVLPPGRRHPNQWNPCPVIYAWPLLAISSREPLPLFIFQGSCDLLGRDLEKPRLPELLDRKSTRLNSSHVAISYAVFCLKK